MIGISIIVLDTRILHIILNIILVCAYSEMVIIFKSIGEKAPSTFLHCSCKGKRAVSTSTIFQSDLAADMN